MITKSLSRYRILFFKYADRALYQYLLGFIFCITLFFILTHSGPVAFKNIQEPKGIYSDNRWGGQDFLSYSIPARNFLEFGVWGEKTIPDYFRTIGYPAFLSLMMKLFGEHWVYATYLLNCLIIPFIFPCLFYICKTLANLIVARNVFIFSLLMGVYTSRAVYIGTDVFFFVFFIAGIYFAVKAFAENRPWYLTGYLLFIGLAAQIRPTLLYFWIINIFLLLFLGRRMSVTPLKTLLRPGLLVITSILIWVMCNIPCFRNYSNYGFWAPSNVLSLNCFEFYAKKIYEKEEKVPTYDSLHELVSRLPIKEQLGLQMNFAKAAILKYPKSAFRVSLKSIENEMLDNNLTNQFGNYYGYGWRDTPDEYYHADFTFLLDKYYHSLKGYKKSNFLHYMHYLCCLIYIGIYLLFGIYLFELIRRKDMYSLLFIFSVLFLLLVPSFIAGDGNYGARMRIPVEWLILMGAFSQLNSWSKRNASVDPIHNSL